MKFFFGIFVSAVCIFSLITPAHSVDVRVCARSCSDGSTYTKCVEVDGLLSQDCHEAIHCPKPLYDEGWAYEFKRGVSFETESECQNALNRMKKDPNLPVIVPEKWKAPAFRRNLNSKQQAIKEAMDWHDEFLLYSPEERLALGQRILSANKRIRAEDYSEQDTRDIARMMFEFVHQVRERTNKTGVYTNSKCAGCSLIVQSIEEKLTSKGCSAISDVISSTLCGATGPALESFCSILLGATEFDAMVSTICESALSKVVDGMGIRDKANLLCSTLTCTNQPTTVSKKSEITGKCDLVGSGDNARATNQRCDELIAICDMAEKGFCVADTIKEFKESVSGGFVEASIKTLADIVTGKTPAAVQSVRDLAVKCTGVKCGGGGDDDDDDDDGSKHVFGSATMDKPFLFAILLVIGVISLVTYF